MKKIFVIGNIGSGKSTFSKMLADAFIEKGMVAVVIDLDKISLSLSKNKDIQKEIIDEFGQYETREDLAQIVFKSKEALDKLTSITHPYIYDEMVLNFKSYEEMGADYLIVEETAYSGKNDNFAKHADILVCVICEDGLRQARCIEKGLSLIDFAQRTTLQPSQMFMMENADIIINNNNDAEELKSQVDKFIEDL